MFEKTRFWLVAYSWKIRWEWMRIWKSEFCHAISYSHFYSFQFNWSYFCHSIQYPRVALPLDLSILYTRVCTNAALESILLHHDALIHRPTSIDTMETCRSFFFFSKMHVCVCNAHYIEASRITLLFIMSNHDMYWRLTGWYRKERQRRQQMQCVGTVCLALKFTHGAAVGARWFVHHKLKIPFISIYSR